MQKRLILAGTGLFAALVLTVAGCQPPDDKPTPPKDTGTKTKEEAPKVASKHKHDKWWCEGHGIPEHECLTCLHTEEELKQKKDWCEKHEFAKSQCFKCDPKLREKYSAMFRAKYGKEPPPIDGDEDEKKDAGKEDADKKDADKDGKK